MAGVVTHAVQNYSKKFRDPSKAPENQIYTKAVSITKYRFFESCITDPKIVINDFINTSFFALIDQKYAKKKIIIHCIIISSGFDNNLILD